MVPNGTMPISGERIVSHQIETAARTRANATPLPGPLAFAFTPAPVKVGQFTVRAPVAYDYALLQQIKSPLYEELLEAAKPKEQQEEQKWTPQDNWNICYQFTRSAGEVDEVFSHGGVEAFNQSARRAIAHQLQPIEIDEIVKAVAQQISLAFATLLKFQSGKEDEDAASTTFSPATAKPAATV